MISDTSKRISCVPVPAAESVGAGLRAGETLCVNGLSADDAIAAKHHSQA